MLDRYRPNPYDFTHGVCKPEDSDPVFVHIAETASQIPVQYGQRGKGSIESVCKKEEHLLTSIVVDGSVVEERITPLRKIKP